MGKVILVIDDSITVCKMLEVCLHREGYEVFCFTDGINAVEWLKMPDARIPNLIFVDLILPQWDGYGVIQYFRTLPVLRQIPFVIISRQCGLTDILKGKLLGAAFYLVKPFTLTELLSVVRASHCLSREPLSPNAGQKRISEALL